MTKSSEISMTTGGGMLNTGSRGAFGDSVMVLVFLFAPAMASFAQLVHNGPPH